MDENFKEIVGALRAFQKFKSLAESESNGASIKCLRMDHDGEFTLEEFSTWCGEKDIQRQLITPHTPYKMELLIGRIGLLWVL